MARNIKGMHKSGGTKNRGRKSETTPLQADSTRPELQVTRRTQASRAGPGDKNMNLNRGDRRDTGARSY